MRIELSPAVLQSLPQLRVSGLIARGIDTRSLVLPAMPSDDRDHDELIARWRAFYRSRPGNKQARCSLEYLLKAQRQGKLRSILPLVDLYNQASLRSLSPFGGEDLQALGGVLRLTLAQGDEPFLPLGKTQLEQPAAGEVVWLNGERQVVCRCLNWLESDVFKLTAASREVVFVSEQPLATLPAGDAGVDWLQQQLQACSTSLQRFSLHAGQPCFES